MRLPYQSIAPFLAACALLLPGCPTNGTGEEGASTTEHEHGAEHGTGSSSGHEHGTGSSSGHATGSSSADDHDHSIDTSAEDPAVAYCSCMLANCHDQYHAEWGDDEMAAEAACLMEADALPMNGSDIDMGNFIECRMHFCELAADDETLCTNAIGDAVCI
jgi:hypothetical protein